MLNGHKNLLEKVLSIVVALTMSLSLLLPSSIVNAVIANDTTSSSPLPKQVLVGYWHNFDNGTGFIKLRDVSPNWDVINISFGEPTTQTSGDIRFTPYNMTEDEFKADVKYLQSKGKKVLLSIGGQNGHVSLETVQTKDVFVKSVCDIIDRYGLDGLDIDFEGGSLHLNLGDKDFKNPTTPVIVNTISALKQIKAKYGSNFLLTMAPETFFVQHGHRYYGGINQYVDNRVGAYLPVIHALRDDISWIQVQYYNSCTIMDNNGKEQNMGNSEFFAALTDMLLNGFTVNNDSSIFFPALREDQVVIGVPSNQGAGNGYVDNKGIQEALDAVIKGGKAGSYTISKPHPNLRGLMAWSINWDNYFKNSFSSYFRNYFNTLTPPVNSLKAAILTSTATDKSDFTLTSNIPSYNTATSYKIYENTTVIDSGNLNPGETSDIILKKSIASKTPGTYLYKIVLSDGKTTIDSNTITVKVTDVTNPNPGGGGNSSLPGKVLVGYWHNFNNYTSTIRLKDVPDQWDVINLSFGEPTTVTSGDIQFVPYNCTEEEFKSDVKSLQNKGKKILLSIGGEKGQVQLKDATAKNNFIKSVSGIIDKYGLDGLDIDFEGHSLYFDAGDTNYKNPKTPVIVNLIDALNQLTTKYGDKFMLTMAPETFFVQLGHTSYGYSASGADQRCGSYLPVIYALRDKINWIQVQYYNSGPIKGLDDQYKTMGNSEFYAALADMLLTGFTVPGNDPFPALREDQVVIGVPACVNAGNGYVDNKVVKEAMDALINGGTAGNWKVSSPHPNLRGMMTWSINWDIFTGQQWSTYFRDYLWAQKPPTPSLKAATLSSTSLNSSDFTLTASIPSYNTAVRYVLTEDLLPIASGSIDASGSSPLTIKKDFAGKAPKTYEYTFELYDKDNKVVASNKITINVADDPNKADVNKDGKIDAIDLALVSDKYNLYKGQSGYDLKLDINNDGIIDIYDLVAVSSKIKDTVEPEPNPNDTFIADKVYNGGDIVIYKGVKYRAKWWTQYTLPDAPGSPWERI